MRLARVKAVLFGEWQWIDLWSSPL